MTSVGIAVIGGGHLGRIHTRLLKLHADVELLGVVDPSPEARERIAAEFAVPTFAHHDEIGPSLRAAIIATNTQFHHAVACDLLNRGVHLFVEKPITTSVALADLMIELARKQSLVLQAGHVERFNPAWRAVARHLHRPRYIDAVRASGYTFRSTDIGVVLDLMIHDLDLVLATVPSEIVEIDAVGGTIFGPHEDMAHAHLRFANGCMASLTASRTSFQSQRSMQVLTERAYVGIDFAAGTAKLVRPSKELVRGQLDVHSLSHAEKDHLKANLFTELLPLEDVPVKPSNAIEEEQKEFIRCVQHGISPSVTGEHARKCLAVAEQILAIIQTQPTGRRPRVFTSPQWHQEGSSSSREQRKAG